MKNMIKVLGLLILLAGLVRCESQDELLSYVTNRNGSMDLVIYHLENENEWMGLECEGDQMYPAFNEDQSKLLYLEDGEERKIKVIHPQGQTFILSVPVSETASDPFWYPNGDFGYVEGKEIHRVTFAYGKDEVVWVSPNPLIRLFWSKDEGNLIASFLAKDKYEVGRLRVETGAYTTLVESDWPLIVSDYNENMKKVLYTEFRESGNRIMTYDLESKETVTLIEDQFRNESGIFDGEKGAVIFQSDRDHAGSEVYNYEIYRWNGKTSGYRRLTNNTAGDYFPTK